jgi:hypothetical protein
MPVTRILVNVRFEASGTPAGFPDERVAAYLDERVKSV